MGFKEALFIGNGIVSKLGAPHLTGQDLNTFRSQRAEELVVDPFQRQIQIGMNTQIIPGSIIFGKNHGINP